MPSVANLLTATVLGLATTAMAACNGEQTLCDRPYSNVTFVGSHDSAFVGELLADNQLVSVADQLTLGVRFLQAQTHNKDGTIEMCHTSCLELDAGSLADYLAPVKTFMDANPDEVVTLLLTNGDAVPVADFAAVFSSLGLEEYVFTPNGTLALDEWPTLQTMINDGTRLVVWMGMFLACRVRPARIRSGFANHFLTKRLQCRHIFCAVYPRRVLVLLRDPLRCDRFFVPRLQH